MGEGEIVWSDNEVLSQWQVGSALGGGGGGGGIEELFPKNLRNEDEPTSETMDPVRFNQRERGKLANAMFDTYTFLLNEIYFTC